MVKDFNDFFKFMAIEKDDNGRLLKEAKEVRDLCKILLLKINQNIQDGEEKNHAVRKIKEATLIAIHSINRDYNQNKEFENAPSVFIENTSAVKVAAS